MKFIPGQPVLVLDIMHKPAGSGIVQVFYEEADRCLVLFQYPHQSQPESIPIPAYRLIPQVPGAISH
jgi:hypothetical protein